MVSTPRSSTESSAASGTVGSGAPRGRRNTKRLDEANDPHTLVPPDVAVLPDRERVFATPRSGDWVLLAIMLITLLGCGGYVWYRLGLHDHIGRAAFFGLALVCLYWTAIIYTFKLSLSVHVGPQGISVVRGPWRMELRWGDVSRLMERAQLLDNRRYRWVVAQARDERRIQVREDMVADYARFRLEVYERYRLWRDHGGTWGTTTGGPFTAREAVGDEVRWWLIGASVTALPGAYFWLLLPETNPLGLALVVIAALCGAMAARAFLLRQRYVVDARMITASYLVGKAQLGWREISRVERSRNPVGGVIRAVAAVCRLAISLASRSEVGLRCFPWSPRVPEYLTLRGAGRHVRVRLHRLARPDELLAWVEFYERVGRRPGGTATRPRQAASTTQLAPDERIAAATISLTDLSDASGPRDPWADASADPIDLPTVPTPTIGAANVASDDYDDDDDEEDEDEEDEEDESAAIPIEALTPEQIEDAWLLSTNVRPVIPAAWAQTPPVAIPATAPRDDEPAAQAPSPLQQAFAPFQSAQPEWDDASDATASGNANDAAPAYPLSGTSGDAALGFAGRDGEARDSSSGGLSSYSEYDSRTRGRPADAGRGGGRGDSRWAGSADGAGRPAYGGYPQGPQEPPEPAAPEPPPLATRWSFPPPPAPAAPLPPPTELDASASPFSVIPREELIAELTQMGPVRPPTPSGVVGQPTQLGAQPPRPGVPSARAEPTASPYADAPTEALVAAPVTADDESRERAAEEADAAGERPEPARPGLAAGWQPPALPRFGPGARSPFHNPDDAD